MGPMDVQKPADISTTAVTTSGERWAALFDRYLQALATRTGQALASAKFGALLLHSGSERYVFRDDLHYPFKVHASFKQWAPLIDGPDCFVFFDPARAKPLLIFHRADDYWHKAAPVPATYWSDCFEIHVAADMASARKLLPADLARTAFVGEAFQGLASFGVGAINPEHLLAALEYPRAVKDGYELACLRQANRLGALGHRAAAAAFSDGGSEFEIALAFMRASGQREKELPYNPIIALNEGAAVLHYQVQEKSPPAALHSLLIDAGCEFAGYASDITRSFSFANPEFAALIGAFDQLQQRLCQQVRAGIEWTDIHQQSHLAIAGWLREAGVVKTAPQETVESGLSAVFYPHGIGHLLGLQVHDAGGTLGGPDGRQIPRPVRYPSLASDATAGSGLRRDDGARRVFHQATARCGEGCATR